MSDTSIIRDIAGIACLALVCMAMIAAIVATIVVVSHDDYVPCHASAHQGWTMPAGCES